MKKIKIISNPYKKTISYEVWSEADEEWIDINNSNNPNSRLISAESTISFFPFVVKKVVDTIYTEYRGDDIQIVFEGTNDEYDDLKLICKELDNDDIEITKSEMMLENARDILPDIIEVFKKVKNLVAQVIRYDDRAEREIDKFAEASNKDIPVCVIGNYSSGKSTFINALIGREILPSGDRPVTAKIFKISKSEADDRAYVYFDYKGIEVDIRYEANGHRILID